MLPSDHFVRMYNELFKMLEERGHDHLQRYWRTISELQESILAPSIERAGLQGMYDYWEHIRIEENCEAKLTLADDYFEFHMLTCPSLTKVVDNDAGLFPLYCDHCAGWVEPLMERHGYTLVYDMIDRRKPTCRMRVYRDPAKAREYARTVTLLARPYEDAGHGKA